VTLANALPDGTELDGTGFKLVGSEDVNLFNYILTDYDFINTLGMKMESGRYFSKEYATDSSAVVLNEAAVKLLGIKGDPIGQQLDFFDRENSRLTIVGIVKNFNFESLQNRIKPVALILDKNSTTMAIRTEPGSITASLEVIESKWKEIAPEIPFEYAFLDQKFDALFKAEQRLGQMFLTLAILAIIIACMGLLGLVAYAAEVRTKEIGIRKVLGAGPQTIVILLTKEITILVITSMLIAIPLAWYLIIKWLENFAYKVHVGIAPFAFALVIAILVAWITISFQAIKAALMNPVNSIKND
jgi:putative ABC transport system permease protein